MLASFGCSFAPQRSGRFRLQVQGLVPLRHVLGDVGHVDLHVLARIDAGGVTGRDLELQQEKGVVHLARGSPYGCGSKPMGSQFGVAVCLQLQADLGSHGACKKQLAKTEQLHCPGKAHEKLGAP